MTNPYDPPATKPAERSKAVTVATDVGMVLLILGIAFFSRIGALIVAFLYWRNRGKIQDRAELEASAVSCPKCNRELGATTRICPRCNYRMDE